MNSDKFENIEILQIDELDKHKKKFNYKAVLLLLILLLIILFGIGLYSFLKFAKENVNNSIIPDKKIEISSNINDFKLELQKDYNNCEYNLDKINNNKLGKYNYNIKCKRKKYKGIVQVVDTIKPEVSLKVVNIKSGDTFAANSFVQEINDATNTTVSFDNDIDYNNYKNNGLYLINIKVVDEGNNETVDSGILLVSNVTASKFLISSKIGNSNLNASLKIIDIIGFNSSDYYINAIREYEYTFNSKSEYDQFKKNNVTNNFVYYNDDDLSVKEVMIIDREELNKLNGKFPSTFEEVKKLYTNLNYKLNLQ